MPYLNDIPQPSDQIAASQPELLANFEYIQTTMEEDHAWNGDIAGVKDGTHNTVSMPNQSVDITSLGDTGCNLIQYAIGSNLFIYNGAKNPVSGLSQTGTITLPSATYVSVPGLSPIPNQAAIGILMFGTSQSNSLQYFPFFSIPGSPPILVVQGNPTPIPNGTIAIQVLTGNTIQVRLVNANDSNVLNYKYIYWPI
jgi:hypothetical protein